MGGAIVPRVPLPRWFVPYALGCAVLAACAPLAVYTLSLAMFGAWHVHTELAWVRERFRGSLTRLVVPLMGISLLRLATWAGNAPSWSVAAELGFGLLLVLLVVSRLHDARSRLTAALLGGGLAAGIVLAPVPTLVGFALLHNLTPLGFFADRGVRLRTPLLLFFGLPLLVAAFPWSTAFDPLSTGGLAKHLGSYVPAVVTGAAAERLFAAAVAGQLLHYGAVIGVMGRWRTVKLPRVELAAAAVAAALFAYFASSFGDARKLYGSVAAVHAWIEFPVLLLALAGRRHQVSQAPRSADAALAPNETTSAREGGSTMQ